MRRRGAALGWKTEAPAGILALPMTPRWSVAPDKTPSPQVLALAEQVERDGGRALSIYQDPVGEPRGVRYEHSQRSAIMAAPAPAE